MEGFATGAAFRPGGEAKLCGSTGRAGPVKPSRQVGARC